MAETSYLAQSIPLDLSSYNSVTQLLLFYDDLTQLYDFITRPNIAPFVKEIVYIWQKHYIAFKPIFGLGIGLVRKLATDNEYRKSIVLSLKKCTECMIVKSILELGKIFVGAKKIWNNLMDFIKKSLESAKDKEIREKLEKIEHYIIELQIIVQNVQKLIDECEQCNVEVEVYDLADKVANELSRANQYICASAEFENLKEVINERIGENEQNIKKIDKSLPLLFLTAFVSIAICPLTMVPLVFSGLSIVFAGVIGSMSQDKIREMNGNLVRLNVYRIEYNKTRQALEELKEKNSRVVSDRIAELTEEFLKTLEAECKCGGCKCSNTTAQSTVSV